MTQQLVLEREQAGNSESAADGIANTWEQATDAVTDAVESVKGTVDATVENVQDTMSTTVREAQKLATKLGRTFDLAEQVRRQPWLMIGGAVLLGVVVSSMLCSSRD